MIRVRENPVCYSPFLYPVSSTMKIFGIFVHRSIVPKKCSLKYGVSCLLSSICYLQAIKGLASVGHGEKKTITNFLIIAK